MNDADIGGDPPCWAHLFDDADDAEGGDATEPAIDAAVKSASQRVTAIRTNRPSHPVVPAVILMVGVVVFLILVSLVTVL